VAPLQTPLGSLLHSQAPNWISGGRLGRAGGKGGEGSGGRKGKERWERAVRERGREREDEGKSQGPRPRT